MEREEFLARLEVLFSFANNVNDEWGESVRSLLEAAEANMDEETQHHLLDLAEKEVVAFISPDFERTGELILHDLYRIAIDAQVLSMPRYIVVSPEVSRSNSRS